MRQLHSSKLRLLFLLLLTIIFLLIHIVNMTGEIPVAVDDVTGFLRVTPTRILSPSMCVNAEWVANGAQATKLNNQSVATEGTQSVCIRYAEQAPTLQVTPVEGEPITFTIPVRITLMQPEGLLFLAAWLLLAINLINDLNAWAMFVRIIDRIPRWPLAVIVAALPVTIAMLMLQANLGKSLFDFYPSGNPNDQLHYWRTIHTFSAVGFRGGYYTYLELPAQAAFTHFGTHGPGFAVLYGLIGKLFGWTPYSAPIINSGFVMLSLLGFVWLTHPDRKKLTLLILVVGSFWPLSLWIMSNMQESIHLSIAIMMAALIHRRWQGDESTGVVLGFWVLLAIGAIIRVSWALIAIPYLLSLSWDHHSWRKTILAIIQAGVIIGVFALIFGTMSAPFPETPASSLATSTNNNGGILNEISHRFAALLPWLSANLEWLFKADRLNYFETVQRYQILLLIGIAAAQLLRYARKPLTEKTASISAQMGFHLANIGSIVGAAIIMLAVASNSWESYRILAPHLLLTILLLVINGQLPKLLVTFCLMNLMLMANGTLYTDYQTLVAPAFNTEGFQTRFESFQKDLENVLLYDASTSNAWCNTLLTNVIGFKEHTPEIMAIPPGIGITLRFPEAWPENYSTTPPKSQYLLLPADGHEPLIDTLNLEQLAETSYGNLYRNPHSGCDYGGSAQSGLQ